MPAVPLTRDRQASDRDQIHGQTGWSVVEGAAAGATGRHSRPIPRQMVIRTASGCSVVPRWGIVTGRRGPGFWPGASPGRHRIRLVDGFYGNRC
jgi:hypothetical protein